MRKRRKQMEINKIYNENCLEGMKRIADGSIDMILCDLPYGTTKCKWDTVIPFEPLWEQYKRVIKHNGAIVLTASQPFTSALVMSNPKMFKYDWVWKKNAGSNFGCVKFQPMKEHEDILVFCFDSSGSVSDEDYAKFMDEIMDIQKHCSKVYLIQADCEVNKVETLTKKTKLNRERAGYGGTAYTPALNKCKELGCDAILYFGDMDCADNPENPNIPLMWVIVGNQNPPATFGSSIRLN